MIIAQLSIAPIGKEVSVSKYVKLVIEILKKENVKFETNAMATVIETENLKTLFDVVEKAHNVIIASGAERVITELKIDDRRDK
ncbi:MAG: MTH1187 family thiamine-binding protein, partial [Candidatus Aminicenantes bacterium]